MNRSEAEKLLFEWVQSESLRRHMRAVACAMEEFARAQNANPEEWFIAGLLHDLDYERFPDWQNGGHPYKAVELLKELSVSQDVIDAILGHASYTGIARKTSLARTLYAVDELCGFIVAVVLIKPSRKLADVSVESVLKRMKEKRFASNVNREDIIQGAGELGVSLDQHVAATLAALQKHAGELGM